MAVQPTEGTPPLKNWQVWPGKNRPCCRGRFLCGPDQGVLTANVCLILINSALFDLFVAPLISPIIIVVDILLVTCSLVSLVHVAFTDPGIIPRQLPIPDDQRNNMTTPSVEFRGAMQDLRFCGTCNLWRPPRSKHCRDCDNCVLEFDHHCPWVSNCIGERNHKYFVWFLVSTCALVCFTVFWSGFVLIRDALETNLAQAMTTNLFASIECIFCFIFAWCLCSLCNYHLWLIANAITTNEQLKHEAVPNSENCLGNFKAKCCVPPAPSLLLLRGDALSPIGTHKPLEHMQRIYQQLSITQPIPQEATADTETSSIGSEPVAWHTGASEKGREVVVTIVERLSPTSGHDREDFQTPLTK